MVAMTAQMLDVRIRGDIAQGASITYAKSCRQMPTKCGSTWSNGVLRRSSPAQVCLFLPQRRYPRRSATAIARCPACGRGSPLVSRLLY